MKKLIAFLLTLAAGKSYSQEITNPAGLFNPVPYGFSHVVSIPANSKLVFVAGQGGEENTDGRLSPDFRTQLRHSLNNIRIALQTQGIPMSKVVKITTLIVNHDAGKLKILIEEAEKVWPDKRFPVNTLIPVPALAIEGMLVEIDAIAVK